MTNFFNLPALGSCLELDIATQWALFLPKLQSYFAEFLKEGSLALLGGNPAAPSSTATLLRLHPSHQFYLQYYYISSGITSSHGVTGGVYKARERIHRSIADLRLLAIPPSYALRPIIPDNTCIPCITAAAGTGLADAYSSSNVRSSSLRKEVYNSQAFIPHAVLLCQAFAHCRIFLTAASRRSLDRVSVPVWLIILSDQLLIVALSFSNYF
eukprot:gene11484-12850_t